MDELDDKKYFENVLKYHKYIDRLDSYNTIIKIIQSVFTDIISNIKLFPELSILNQNQYKPGTNFLNGNIYTNYNFYYNIRWCCSREQYYNITDEDRRITICFFDNKNQNFTIYCNCSQFNYNGNIEGILNGINRDHLKNFNFIKMIHPKVLFMYSSMMDLDECEIIYKKLNTNYNLTNHTKQEYDKLTEKYESQLRFIKNENNEKEELINHYVDELTNSQIIIKKNIMEIKKYEKVNNSLIKKIIDLTN